MRIWSGISAGWLAAMALPAAAQQIAPVPLEAVTVSATREPVATFTVPASIDLRSVEQDGMGVSLADSLQSVPGLLARERQNYAQDTQISIRGFGARSPFGIRGVRLYADGVPATQPDGQGQISQFNLATADRVEVLRGPFSALYGNSSGGVIQLFTADAAASPELQLTSFLGGYGDRRLSAVASGFGATVGYTDFRTEGYRPHSAAQRGSLNAKVDRSVLGGKLTLLLNHLEAPDAQDPLGLNRAQFDADPSQTTTQATQFNTRKDTRQTQLGAVYDLPLASANSLRLMSYGGRREITQFLAIPIGSQASPRSAGGVVDLGTQYGGGDVRFSHRRESMLVVAGLSADTLRQHRRGFENFVGTQTGVQGALRRDEINTVTSFDQYLQLDWTLSPRFSTLAGLRNSRVRFQSKDRFVTSGNPDDSGAAHYSAVTPVAGLMFRQSPVLHWYAAYGTGFETPTFAELAYRSDGQAGLNFDLDAARSRNSEVGLKLRPFAGTQLGLALFRVDARNELVTASNSGGRASFANAARTRREGAELALQSTLNQQFDLALAYTYLDATVREAYLTCASVPCTTPQTQVARGNRLPGVAQGQWYAKLGYAPLADWSFATEVRGLDAVAVNDSNTEFAPSYAVLDLEAAYQRHLNARQDLKLSLRVENVLDDSYAGSVIVNDSNGRYYESARGRTLLVGLQLSLRR